MKTLIFLGIPKKFELRAAKKYAKVIILQRQDSIIEIDSSRQELLVGVEVINYQDIDNDLFATLARSIDPADTYVYINETTLIDAYKIIDHFALPQSADITPRVVEMLSDKSKFRKESKLVEKEEDLRSLLESVQGHIIVKPVNGVSSLNVMILEPKQSTAQVWKQVQAAMQKDKGIKFLAEEYFAGKQYSVDAYWSDDLGYQFTPFCEQVIGYDFGYDDLRTCYSKTVNDDEGDFYQKTTLKLAEILKQKQFRLAIMHIEFRVNSKGEVFIIEVNPRIGGLRNLIYRISYGFSHIDNVIKSILGIKDLEFSTKLVRSSVVLHFWANSVGKFSSIDFYRMNEPRVGVHLERVEAVQGRLVGPPSQGFQKAGYTVISSDKNYDINTAISEVFYKTKVITE